MKGLFIDLDGTLANSMDLMWLSYSRFLAEHQCTPTQAEFDRLNGPPLPVVIQKLKDAHRLLPDMGALTTQYNAIIDELYVTVQPNTGARELIEAAKTVNCKLVLVTSNTKVRARTWLSTHGLLESFHAIVAGDDVTRGKPDPEPYLLALKICGIPAQEAAAIEDSKQGAASAMAAGIRTFLLSHAGPSDGGISPRSPEVVPSLSAVQVALFN